MDEVFLKEIYWLSYSSREAKLIISDGIYSLLCFSCPCEYAIGDEINEPLECLDVRNIYVSEEDICSVEKENGTFSYNLCGKLYDANEGIVHVGKLKLHVKKDNIPKDIQTGQFIQFSTSRIDLF